MKAIRCIDASPHTVSVHVSSEAKIPLLAFCNKNVSLWAISFDCKSDLYCIGYKIPSISDVLITKFHLYCQVWLS